MNWAQHVVIFGIRLYRWTISPLLATLAGPMGRCRFNPNCSQYAIDAVRGHGAIKGSVLAVWRICRCNPWGGCGDDPVPEKGTPIFKRHHKAGESHESDHSQRSALAHHVANFSEGHC